MGTGRRGSKGGGLELNHLHLVLRIEMRGPVHLSIHTSSSCVVHNEDNCTLPFLVIFEVTSDFSENIMEWHLFLIILELVTFNTF
jgi:hypothetical protein